jgi:hypothetical protein
MTPGDLVSFTSDFFRRCGTPAALARTEAEALVTDYLDRVDPDGLVNLDRLHRLMSGGDPASVPAARAEAPGDFVAVAVLLGFTPRPEVPA